MKIKKNLCRCISVILLLTLCNHFCFLVRAEESGQTEGQSNIVNGGFETPDLKTQYPKYKWRNASADSVEGWATTSTDKLIEFGWMLNGTSEHMVPTTITVITEGEGASDGAQFAEVVSDEPSSLYQSLSLKAGYQYNWTVHHRGRTGVDTAAIFITDDTHIDYVKSSSTSTDHFGQILDWMKENGVAAPEAGTMTAHTVYTTALKESNSFEEASTGSCFSSTPDEEHSVKFEIYLVSTDAEHWGEYTGSYFSEATKDILFVLTPFASSYTKDPKTAGNLIDNLRFSDSQGNNLFVNAGFDDVIITSSNGYQYLQAANSSSPGAGIGWCTTASGYKVEVGNLEKGNAYSLPVTIETTVLNAPSIREGNQFVELNAAQESSLYQIVTTEVGKMYRWSLSHRGREGLDTMALIIGPKQEYDPKKVNSQSRDQLMQIADWLYSQTDVALDIPEQGCSQKITLYTPEFNSTGGWALSDGIFSWQKDANHTEEWSVWIISSQNDTWHDYGELDSDASYNFEYIVPEEHSQSIFGFVSINSTKADGTKNKTYGNLLDNISFKEYYFIDVNNATNSGGSDLSIVYDEDHFLPENPNSGWALAGKDISIHLKKGEREIIGAYIDNTFVPISKWSHNEESEEYIYKIENVSKSVKVEVIYIAHTVVYDSRNDYEYQYDEINGGFEIILGPSIQEGALQEYVSHAPKADDGWEFVGWKYISPTNNQVYMLDAVHKVVFVEDATDIHDSTFAIYKILPDDEPVLIVDKIPYDEGVTLTAEWRYRQRVISKTFDNDSSEYDISTEGGDAKITVISGTTSEKTDYIVGSNPVGEELYSSDGTYINVSAYQQTGYTFNGWYDASGNPVSNSISYTYKVDAGKVVELYAYFEPVGYDISVTCSVEDDNDSARYFAINCTFSNLRENKVYTITGLSDASLTVDGATVTNPTLIKADESGKATVTVYMKHGDAAKLVFLPENCVYSVLSRDYKDEGFNVRGEVNSGVLKQAEPVDLKYYPLSQAVKLEAGKHYAGVISGLSPDRISITRNSSYTLDVTTRFNPKIYTGLNLSLCFYDTTGTAKAFAPDTRILMIDFTDENNPRYFQYLVPTSGDPVSIITLEQFKALATHTSYERNSSGSGTILERLVFLIDYVGCASVESGRIALVYNDAGNELIQTVKPDQRAVEIGEDATQLTVTPGAQEGVANIGRFELNVTLGKSTYTVNTAYDGEKYAIRLELDGKFPDGSYVEVDGERYYSNNGCITVSPLSGGDFTFAFDSPLPIPLTDGKATLTATLLPAVSTARLGSEEKRTTVSLNGVDAENCAIDAEPSDTALSPGHISQAEITLKYAEIDGVRLTVSKKNGDGSYSAVVRDVNISLPTGNTPFTIGLDNGFDAVSGETYILSFVGYVDGIPICSDVCCVVIGY